MPKLSDVHSLHGVIIDEIVKLFDKSVWSLRDIVRVTELVMLPNYPTGKRKAINNQFQNRLGAAQLGPSFPLLHDSARHTVHSSETVDVAIDTIAGIQNIYCHADETPWMPTVFPSEDAFEHFKYCPQESPHSPLVERFFAQKAQGVKATKAYDASQQDS